MTSRSENLATPSRVFVGNIAWYAVGVFVALHGLAHLIATGTYFDETGDLYRTTILWGELDLGDTGIRVWGALYAITAAGFVVSAAGMILRRQWWKPALASVLLLSILITFMELDRAYIGFVINIALIIGLIIHAKL